jgi:N-acetylneuraminate synthase
MKKAYIIAEAGVNHNGDLKIAEELIFQAKKCGADAVKFQSFRAKDIVSIDAPKAEYQIKNLNNEISQYQMLKNLELSEKDHYHLIKKCEENKIDFLSSPFDIQSIKLLVKVGLKVFKIPSGEITNVPFLREIGKLNKKIILSTGMATIDEVGFALKVLIKAGSKKENITILQCHTDYPTKYKDVNLNAMMTLKNTFDTEIGYSDHTPGIEIPVAAVALGAKIIEKHFTIDKSLPGPDHIASLEPKEFKSMVIAIRNVENAMGNGIKKPTSQEFKNLLIVRKSIFTARKIKKGHIISEDDLVVKRPGDGISAVHYDKVIGKKAKHDLEMGIKLNLFDIT